MTQVVTKPKADFSYTKIKRDGITVICIVENVGVTNDIENVVNFICYKEKLDKHECGIIYRDSMNTWDGWNTKTGWFIALSTSDKKVAINKIVKYKHSQK